MKVLRCVGSRDLGLGLRRFKLFRVAALVWITVGFVA